MSSTDFDVNGFPVTTDGQTVFEFEDDSPATPADLGLNIKVEVEGRVDAMGVLVADKVYDAVVEGSGSFQHGFTYIGHPTACAAALAVQRAVEEEDLLSNVRTRGAALRGALEARFGNHHKVGDIRGRGLFIGLELVQDRTTKAPPDPAAQLPAAIKRAASRATRPSWSS